MNVCLRQLQCFLTIGVDTVLTGIVRPPQKRKMSSMYRVRKYSHSLLSTVATGVSYSIEWCNNYMVLLEPGLSFSRHTTTLLAYLFFVVYITNTWQFN